MSLPSSFTTIPTGHRVPATAPSILLIDDNPDDRALAIRALREDDSTLRVVEITTAEAFERALSDGPFDAVVTDYQLRWSDGLTVLQQIKERAVDCPVILFTDSGSEEVAVAAMKAGADDYVIKGPRRARSVATAVRLARERARLRIREQEALRLRDAFLMSAGHELRTPLTVLIGYLDLFQERVAIGEVTVSEQDRSWLEVIVRKAATLRHLVTDLLDVARLSTGVLSLDTHLIDLCAITRRAVEEAGPLLRKHSQTLDLACPADPLVVHGDPLRLEQALQNLLDNAVRYSPGGGPVTVTLVQAGSQACLSIKDRGIGIPEADQTQVFERFYRAGNINPLQTSGFGLGLYLTRAIVEHHGGTITVESAEGQGSTFTIYLPLGSLVSAPVPA
jgi:signal transduction histidine kinase